MEKLPGTSTPKPINGEGSADWLFTEPHNAREVKWNCPSVTLELFGNQDHGPNAPWELYFLSCHNEDKSS